MREGLVDLVFGGGVRVSGEAVIPNCREREGTEASILRDGIDVFKHLLLADMTVATGALGFNERQDFSI